MSLRPGLGALPARVTSGHWVFPAPRSTGDLRSGGPGSSRGLSWRAQGDGAQPPKRSAGRLAMSGHCGGEARPACEHPRWTFTSLGWGAQKGPLLCRHSAWAGPEHSASVYRMPACARPRGCRDDRAGAGPGGGARNGKEKHTVVGGCGPEAVPAPAGPRPWPCSQGLWPSLSEGPPAEVPPSGGTKPRDKRPWKRRPGDRWACEDGASSQGTQGARSWKDPSGEPPGKRGPTCRDPGLGGPARRGPGLGGPGPERTQRCGLQSPAVGTGPGSPGQSPAPTHIGCASQELA